jgi:hypothetical protein
MSQSTNNNESESGGVMSRVRTPLLFLLGLVLVLGGYYFLYAQKKTNYLVGRNLRLLATLGNMVGEAITSYGDWVKNESDGKALERRGLTSTDCPPGEEEIEAVRKSRNPLFRLEGQSLELAWRGPRDDEAAGSGTARLACYEIDKVKAFSALLDSKGVFDGVLLAKTSGEVVYQHLLPDIGITDLGPLLAKSVSGDSKKSAGPSAAAEVSSFSSTASYLNVELGGRDYKLFIQPIRLPVGSSYAAGANGTWLLCGVVTADKFVYKSLAISSSILLAILAPLVLAALAWPLIRLRLIGERQRVRVFDVLLLGMCSLFGIALLTLSLLDVYAYAELKSVSAEQLRAFALDMASQVSEETLAAQRQLADLQKLAVLGGYTASDPRSEQAREVSTSWKRFALVDEKGMQRFRWSQTRRKNSPQRFIDVHDREYFKRVLKDEGLWTLPGSDARGGSFFLESVSSRTSNRREAVIAGPVLEDLKERGFAVATLSIPMLSAIDPITPPGFEFAVIDDRGRVLFHSNPARNGIENFFTETDDDQRLRSAVFARRGEEMGVRYFGEDYMAMVQPVEKLPLTVVALCHEEQLQGLNMGWVVATILFLLFTSSPFALALLAIVIARPGYRAPWLWPDPHRAGDYMNLAALLALYCAGFGVAIERLPGTGQLLGIAWTLPFFALLTCYVRLRKRTTSLGKIAGYAGYFLLSIALVWALFGDRGRGDAGSWRDYAAAVAVALLILSAGVLSARHPARWRRWAEKFHLPVSRAYPLAALLFVVLTTVLPTVGIFKAVHRLELYSFIRHGQLQLARGLAEKDALTKGEDQGGNRVAPGGTPGFGFYGSSFFRTHPLEKEARCPCKPGEITHSEPLPEILHDLLPHYSVQSAEMRELLHDRATDCSWDSHRVLQDSMDLHLRGGGGPEIHLRSRFPRLFAGTAEEMAMAGFFGEGSVGALVADTVLSLCLFFLFLSLLFQLVLFISQHLFLIDVREPLWTITGGTLAPIAGRNLFLVRKSPISQVEADAMGLKYLHLGEIEQAGDPGGDVLALRSREVVDSGSGVLVAGFEHRISDSAFNARKLALLENLMELRERSIIVWSQVSPVCLFSYEPAGSPGLHDRWRSVLSSFTLVEEDLRSRRASSRAPGLFWVELLKPFLRWRGLVGATSEFLIIKSPVLREESGRDPFLRKIAQGVDPGRHGMGREQLLEEFGERAEGYYSAVWESCSRDEKVVLQHLAQEGLVHEKNRRVIRRLMARGLIRRGPNLCLLNESFRRFACSALCKSEVLELEKSAAPSAWDRFRWPFLAALSASLAFFFATQQQLLDSTLAVMTGLTAGLPAVVKIIDLLGGKRPAASK